MERFGEKLSILRARSGLSVRQLAKALEIRSTGYITELEKGKKKPSTAVLLRISRYFDISADLLLRDELDLD